jgi:HD-GYP domain-containing protein (c-di-GMP phosphodiesterase class II)
MRELYEPSSPHLIEVPVNSLQPGMFIAELDRPWLDTPFAVQGFFVHDHSDVDYVSKHCDYVYLDPQRQETRRITEKRFKVKRRDKVNIKSEFKRAKVGFESASQIMESVFSQISINRRLDVEAIHKAVNPLIDSVFRNREALAALVRMQDKDDYFYNHALATAVWSTILGRHMGLDRTELLDLALASSIMDVGMADLPRDLVDGSNVLTPTERCEVQKHVTLSLKMVKDSKSISDKVLNAVACHHERYDGSGYPRGLKSNQIPLLARIAGLADTYDAMLSERLHSPGRSSFDAVQELTDLKDKIFQGSLVEQFIQTIGMFPTGSVVELNTGEVGVVVEQNESRRLRPKVVIILDREKSPRTEYSVIDLCHCAQGADKIPAIWISEELKSGAYGINPHDHFL